MAVTTLPPTSDEGCSSKTALELKGEGNAYFQKGNYDFAAGLYTMAINKEPSAVLYGNRSLAFLKMELYGAALEDATDAIKIDNTYIKGYFRRASALMALGKIKNALRDYDVILRAHPTDSEAKKQRDACKKLAMNIAFKEAIAVDPSPRKHITERINLDNIVVENSYSGLKLEGPVTAIFMEELIQYFKKQQKLHIKYAFKLLLDFYILLKKLPNMVEIQLDADQEFTICGDVHGQFYDLCHIFELRGLPSDKNPYLFNGDFVDRGSFSVETIFTLIGFKLLYPQHFFLARGNHESDIMNRMYGFEGEVKAKYNDLMSEFFTELFCYLPLCHLINKKIFICHGGLFSQDGVTFDDIQAIDRVRQPPDQGIMCDLLWFLANGVVYITLFRSDPCEPEGKYPSKRGVGIMFDVSRKWCNENGVDYIIRSHEMKPEGFETHHKGRVYTLFSAPNYCDTMGNKGAYAVIKGNDFKPNFFIFDAVEHPPVAAMRYASNMFVF